MTSKHRYKQKTKNFSNHINTRIPTFKETQIATPDAVSKTLPSNAKIIDIGSTEGGFINTIGALRKDINALGIDPNKRATEVFNTLKEDNTEIVHRAFTDNKNEYNKKAFPDENTGEDVLYFNNDSIPDKSIDMISEKMTFQFIDKGREDKVKIIKSKLKPDGFALFEEKFFTGENDIKWIANENKKDKFKEQYYSKREISDKAKKVLRKMNKRQVTPNEFEKVLKNNFKNVVQYWDAGNFKGYIASDSEDTISKFTNNLINLDSNFSTSDPKRIVQGMKETTSIEVGGLNILLVPWINSENQEMSHALINKSRASVCMGHLELIGFRVHRGYIMEHGTDASIFNKFDKVFSGHYHTRSDNGKIFYLGNPYEIYWNDCNDTRGFHLFDTETKELTAVDNPYRIFHVIYYEDHDHQLFDARQLENKIVKVVVKKKSDQVKFEKFIDKLYSANVAELKIVENFALTEAAEFEAFESEDTLSILNRYIEESETDIDRSKVQKLIQEVYQEACELV